MRNSSSSTYEISMRCVHLPGRSTGWDILRDPKQKNHLHMKKAFVLLLFVSQAAWAQFEVDQFLKGSVADAKLVTEGYMKPFASAWAASMNQGWYNTAKVHKFPGFDLTITVNPVMIPSDQRVFAVDNTKLSNLLLTRDANGQAVAQNGTGNIPTFFGPDTSPQFSTRPVVPGSSFSGLSGIDFNYLPVPMAHLGIGLPKGFDLKLRFVPELNFNLGDTKGNFSLWGVGIMHDIKQYIPRIKSLPFDLSAFVAHTQIRLNMGINPQRADQQADFQTSATTIQGLISKKISVLTVYGGLGYNIATTNMDVKGAYDFNDDGTFETRDPFTVEGSATGPRVTAGLRLKFGPITFHGDYTLQTFSALSLGFGIAVR
jgi:hypothetical protein